MFWKEIKTSTNAVFHGSYRFYNILCIFMHVIACYYKKIEEYPPVNYIERTYFQLIKISSSTSFSLLS